MVHWHWLGNFSKSAMAVAKSLFQAYHSIALNVMLMLAFDFHVFLGTLHKFGKVLRVSYRVC